MKRNFGINEDPSEPSGNRSLQIASMQSTGMQSDIRYQSLEAGQLYSYPKHTTTSKIIEKFNEMTGCVGWGLVFLSIAYLVYYFSLSWIVFPVILFVVFLASGGPSFPKVFFRTFCRDLR